MKVFTLRLNKEQIDRISEFLANLALVFFTAMVLPLFAGIKVDLFTLFAGVFLSSGFLVISLLILKKWT